MPDFYNLCSSLPMQHVKKLFIWDYPYLFHYLFNCQNISACKCNTFLKRVKERKWINLLLLNYINGIILIIDKDFIKRAWVQLVQLCFNSILCSPSNYFKYLDDENYRWLKVFNILTYIYIRYKKIEELSLASEILWRWCRYSNLQCILYYFS